MIKIGISMIKNWYSNYLYFNDQHFKKPMVPFVSWSLLSLGPFWPWSLLSLGPFWPWSLLAMVPFGHGPFWVLVPFGWSLLAGLFWLVSFGRSLFAGSLWLPTASSTTSMCDVKELRIFQVPLPCLDGYM